MVCLPDEVIEAHGLRNVVPRNNCQPGRTRTINFLQSEKNDSKWTETRAPGSRQKRTLLALAIATAVRVVLKNHTYKVGDTIFRQTEGGPIGLELTGTVSRPFMMKWNKHYLEKVEQAGMSMHLYKIYVDDSNQIAEVLPTGSEYDSETGEIVI